MVPAKFQHVITFVIGRSASIAISRWLLPPLSLLPCCPPSSDRLSPLISKAFTAFSLASAAVHPYTMKSVFSLLALALAALVAPSTASVFMPYSMQAKTTARGSFSPAKLGSNNNDLRWAIRQRRTGGSSTAMAIPGYGVAEQVFVGGFGNFLSIYNLIITARILLSWFPQAQGVAALQPVYAITDPYLNLFRGLIPPIFGLDLSPILAFFLLNVLTNATAAVGYELTPEMKAQLEKRGVRSPLARLSNKKSGMPSMNY